MQDVSTPRSGRLAPFFERPGSRAYGGVNIPAVGFGNGTNQFTRRRIVAFEGLAAGGGHPFTVNIVHVWERKRLIFLRSCCVYTTTANVLKCWRIEPNPNIIHHSTYAFKWQGEK